MRKLSLCFIFILLFQFFSLNTLAYEIVPSNGVARASDYATIIVGDCNMDFRRDLKDVLILREKIVNTNEKIFNEETLSFRERSDIDLDNELNMKDVLLLRKGIANIIDLDFIKFSPNKNWITQDEYGNYCPPIHNEAMVKMFKNKYSSELEFFLNFFDDYNQTIEDIESSDKSGDNFPFDIEYIYTWGNLSFDEIKMVLQKRYSKDVQICWTRKAIGYGKTPDKIIETYDQLLITY